ncbi:hypothetical protein [Microbulbifer variabilis]|uniref:hypothetical protein n=1 Tax=Microbulbifer variabilis TaxID=266805 RepID=UPI001CFF0B9B|nr:hypothetical protein [Microbulbifer variabilis]
MKHYKAPRLFFLMMTLSLLGGCGVAHVKTDVHSQSFEGYKNIQIEDVRVYSKERSAKNNSILQEKLKGWEVYSREKLEEYARESNYQIVKSSSEAEGKTLLVDLDVNVQYGNRALRWAIGFGAGKGGVESVLTVKDSETGIIKFKAHADSDLSMGGAGGDIEAVLKKNIKALIDQYRGA